MIQFNLIKGAGLGSTRCSVHRVDLERNLIQINKVDWVYALGLAASGNACVLKHLLGGQDIRIEKIVFSE